MNPGWDDAPCGLVRVDDAGRLVAWNRFFARLCGLADGAEAPRLEALFRPAARLWWQVGMQPSLMLHGQVEEVYLELSDGADGVVPVLVNARRDAGSGMMDWAVMRIEQRGRWEEAVVSARSAAEHANRELAGAKAELESVLAELKDSHWMLRKAAEVLPTCMYCGKVKSPGREGVAWENAIEFLKRNARFLSHGCCPSCVRTMREQMGLEIPDAEAGDGK